MIYPPHVHTGRVSGGKGIITDISGGGGGKADVKWCHGRLIRPRGNRKSQTYIGGVPG